MHLCEGIGDFLDTILKGFLDHRLDEGVELGLYSHLHLGIIIVDGQHLHPNIEGYGRLYGLELDAFGLLTLTDAELELTHGGDIEANGVLIEGKIVDLVLGHAVANLLKVAQVADIVVDGLLRVGNELDTTLEFRFTSK